MSGRGERGKRREGRGRGEERGEERRERERERKYLDRLEMRVECVVYNIHLQKKWPGCQMGYDVIQSNTLSYRRRCAYWCLRVV